MDCSQYENILFAAELADDTPTLDLHGATVNTAHHEVLDFLSQEHAQGKRSNHKVVKIITGYGAGKIKEELRAILTKKDLDFVACYRYQNHPLPSDASLYIVLAPNTNALV